MIFSPSSVLMILRSPEKRTSTVRYVAEPVFESSVRCSGWAGPDQRIHRTTRPSIRVSVHSVRIQPSPFSAWMICSWAVEYCDSNGGGGGGAADGGGGV